MEGSCWCQMDGANVMPSQGLNVGYQMDHLDQKRLDLVIYLVLRMHQFPIPQKYHLLRSLQCSRLKITPASLPILNKILTRPTCKKIKTFLILDPKPILLYKHSRKRYLYFSKYNMIQSRLQKSQYFLLKMFLLQLHVTSKYSGPLRRAHGQKKWASQQINQTLI